MPSIFLYFTCCRCLFSSTFPYLSCCWNAFILDLITFFCFVASDLLNFIICFSFQSPSFLSGLSFTNSGFLPRFLSGPGIWLSGNQQHQYKSKQNSSGFYVGCLRRRLLQTQQEQSEKRNYYLSTVFFPSEIGKLKTDEGEEKKTIYVKKKRE